MSYIWTHRVVDYTFQEICAAQRALRRQRDVFIRERTNLEERIMRGGHDGELMRLESSHRVLNSEVEILEQVIRKNWYAITHRGQGP